MSVFQTFCIKNAPGKKKEKWYHLWALTTPKSKFV